MQETLPTTSSVVGSQGPETVKDGAATLFLQRNVFPGGDLLHVSEVIRSAEEAGFEVLDLENLRPHYALTCRAWVTRLQAAALFAKRSPNPGRPLTREYMYC